MVTQNCIKPSQVSCVLITPVHTMPDSDAHIRLHFRKRSRTTLRRADIKLRLGVRINLHGSSRFDALERASTLYLTETPAIQLKRWIKDVDDASNSDEEPVVALSMKTRKAKMNRRVTEGQGKKKMTKTKKKLKKNPRARVTTATKTMTEEDDTEPKLSRLLMALVRHERRSLSFHDHERKQTKRETHLSVNEYCAMSIRYRSWQRSRHRTDFRR